MFLIIYSLSIVGGVLFSFQYVKYLPYFDETISIVFGFLCFLLVWIQANSLLIFVVPVTGHFLAILVGVVPIYILAVYVRQHLVSCLLLKQPDKIESELEAIIQAYAIYAMSKPTSSEEAKHQIAGLIEMHLQECHKPECPLHDPAKLYDPCVNQHVEEVDTATLHTNRVFLKHFVKMYFEESINNFGTYPGLRIAYASFLLYSFGNVNAALTQLACAKRSKLSTLQNFEVYKFEYSPGFTLS
jgi:hypothetical protein